MDREELRKNDLYAVNATATWARNNLQILFDMAIDGQLPQWFAEEIQKIREGIETVGIREARREERQGEKVREEKS